MAQHVLNIAWIWNRREWHILLCDEKIPHGDRVVACVSLLLSYNDRHVEFVRSDAQQTLIYHAVVNRLLESSLHSCSAVPGAYESCHRSLLERYLFSKERVVARKLTWIARRPVIIQYPPVNEELDRSNSLLSQRPLRSHQIPWESSAPPTRHDPRLRKKKC
jgi:hypothetical protein